MCSLVFQGYNFIRNGNRYTNPTRLGVVETSSEISLNYLSTKYERLP